MKGANVKHGTRGRKEAYLVLRTHQNRSNESGTLVRPSLDLDAVARVWEQKGQVRPPVDFLTRLGDLVEGQQASLNGTFYYSVYTPVGKAIDRVRKDAIRLVESLQKLEAMDGGKNVVEALAVASVDFDPRTLQDFVNSAFLKGYPAWFFWAFIRRVRELFVEFELNAKVHENSFMVNVLKEIERQFPGLPRSVTMEGTRWRSFVNDAIAKTQPKNS